MAESGRSDLSTGGTEGKARRWTLEGDGDPVVMPGAVKGPTLDPGDRVEVVEVSALSSQDTGARTLLAEWLGTYGQPTRGHELSERTRAWLECGRDTGRSAPTDEDRIERGVAAIRTLQDVGKLPRRIKLTQSMCRSIARAVLDSLHTPTGEREGCPTCGSPVRVVSGDEGTTHYEPDYRYDLLAKRPSRFSGVDAKAALRELLDVLPEYMGYAVYLNDDERADFDASEERVANAMEKARSALAGGESE